MKIDNFLGDFNFLSRAINSQWKKKNSDISIFRCIAVKKEQLRNKVWLYSSETVENKVQKQILNTTVLPTILQYKFIKIPFDLRLS